MAQSDAISHTAQSIPRRAFGVRRVRLIGGLVLFVYAALHFANHALGNISLQAMDDGLRVQKLIWQSLPGALILYGALLTHMGLGFWALYERRQFRWTRLEAMQLVLGLTIPFLLADHIFGTRVSLTLFGLDKAYPQELYKFWVKSPGAGFIQAALILIVWTHGCLGLHFWLRLRPNYARVRNLLLSLAVLLPALALLGDFQGGRQVQALASDPAWMAREFAPAHAGTAAQNADIAVYWQAALATLAALLAGAVLARAARRWRERRAGTVRLTYPDRTIRVARGLSVLEASLRNAIPHAHVCGGRGRCSTCRIRVLDELDGLPPASAEEQAVLDRIGATPGVRLACQLRPDDDIAFVPLLPPNVSISDLRRGDRVGFGDERYLVMMFVDMRGSSRLAETRLPYDTVFIVNQFLNAVSRGIVAAGGQLNGVLGDGVLALFGLDVPPREACRQAVAACARIGANVRAINLSLAQGLNEPLRFGIGINGGTIVAGEIGYDRHAQFTVIGDAVNVAARLEALTKTIGCEVLMSEEVYAEAGFGPDDLPAHEVDARGRKARVKVRSAAVAEALASPQSALA